jgi:hypothetical protein
MIEKLYEEVLEEGAIIDWFKEPKNRLTLKQLLKELTMMGMFAVSPPTMAIYVNDFLQKNFPNLGSDIIRKIAEFISNNPQILDLIKA